MGNNSGLTFPGRVNQVRARIEEWRRHREGHAAMPEALWAAVVALARNHGVYRVSKAAGVSYGSLKKRLAQAGDKAAAGRVRSSAGFIELGDAVDSAQLFGTSEAQAAVVELWGADGSKLVIRLSGREGLDVSSLLEVFRRHRG